MCVPKKKGGMGFRDIHSFNLALLAKQAWRLIDNPDSLCAIILRAKYFPDGDLMSATLKQKSSYTWQSIMAGVDTLRRGYIWRIGDGEKVNIWEDSWIPQSPTRKVLTIRGNNLITRVCDLIDPATGDWDSQLVNLTFWEVDVQRILSIPLPVHEMSDFIAWDPTKNGIFSVRSAYQVEWNAQFGHLLQTRAESSYPDEKWNLIWSL